jgi:antitoxin component YwqK of YwqJK toxin-antitoxin module
MKVIALYTVLFISFSISAQNKFQQSETTFGNGDSIVYLKSTMNPINGIIVFSDNVRIEGRREISFKNGKYDGVNSWWSSNGQLISQINFSNGKRNGSSKSWHLNGRLKEEAYYKNDILNGIRKYFYDNGQICYEENYLNGLKHLKNKCWYENGQLMWEENYINGQRNGLQVHWYENGLLSSKINCKNGLRNGTCITWYDNGNKRFEGEFKLGIEINLNCWDQTGKIINCDYLSNE